MKIGYARVSTEHQVLDLQIDALTKAGCEALYRDEGISGYAVVRPGLDACLASLKKGDCLVVWKLDRLGRSLEHLITTVKKMEEEGIGFQSLSEGFDTTTPAGKMIFHVIGALAQFERELIKERVNAGLAAAVARGTKLGRRFSIKPEDRTKAIKLHNDGLSFGEIGKELGMSRGSAHRIVREHLAA